MPSTPDNETYKTAYADALAHIPTWADAIASLVSRALSPLDRTAEEIQRATWNVILAGGTYQYLTDDPSDRDNFIVDASHAYYPACPLMGEAYSVWRTILQRSPLPTRLPNLYDESMDVAAMTEFTRFWTEELGYGAREEKLLAAFMREIENPGSRRAFRTENGLVGMAPEDARVGDVAVVLYGAGPIFVLRKMEGKGDAEGRECWRTVGDGYVYGCMTLADTAVELKEKDEDFIIG